MYDGGVAELFDIAETRRSLLAKRDELLAECEANSKLQRRFDQIAAQLRSSSPVGPDANAEGSDYDRESLVDDEEMDTFAEASFLSSFSQDKDFQDEGNFGRKRGPPPSLDDLYQTSSDNTSGKRAPSFQNNKFPEEDSR